MKQKILVVVDMQNDFVDGALGSEDAQGIIDNVIREIKSNEYSKIYVTLDSHNPDYLNTYEGKNLPVVSKKSMKIEDFKISRNCGWRATTINGA